MLHRSGTQPLRIKIANVGRNLTRINGLGLHFQRCYQLEVDHEGLSSALPYLDNTPTLQVLKITGRARETLPQSLIHTLQSCPTLTHLEIEDYRLQWRRIPVVPALKTLRLDNGASRCKSGLITDMHKVLSSMPALEDLDLAWMTAWDILPQVDPSASVKPPVVLPNLKSLTIADSRTQDIQAFFASISIPPTTTIEVEVEDLHDGDREHIPVFLHSLGAIYNNTGSSGHGVSSQWKGFSKLELNTGGYYNRLSLWDNANIGETKKPRLLLQLFEVEIPFLLTKLKDAVGLSSLRWLSVNGENTVDLDAWLFFASVTTLETITLGWRTSIPVFFSTITGTIKHPLSTSHIPFPGLRELHFKHVNFEQVESDLLPFLDTLSKTIKGRPSAQRLTKVRIENSRNVRASSVEHLHEVVQVEWDEV